MLFTCQIKVSVEVDRARVGSARNVPPIFLSRLSPYDDNRDLPTQNKTGVDDIFDESIFRSNPARAQSPATFTSFEPLISQKSKKRN